MPEIKCNYHTHTIYCDGSSSPEEIVREAVSLGMPELGFSGHSYTSIDESYCMSREGMREYFDEINGLKDKYAEDIKILCGIEMDLFSDPEDYDYGWDYIIGSCHYIKKVGEYFPVDESEDILKDACERLYSGDIYSLISDYFSEVSSVARITKCDIAGHFDLITKFNDDGHLFDEKDPRYILSWMKALDVLSGDRSLIFEINTGAMSRGYRTSPYPSEDILAELARRGCSVILSSDSHDKTTLMYGFDEAEALAGKTGLRPLQTLPW